MIAFSDEELQNISLPNVSDISIAWQRSMTVHFRSAKKTEDVCVTSKFSGTLTFNSRIFIFPKISTTLIGWIATERRLLIGWRQHSPPLELANSRTFHFLGQTFKLFRMERGGLPGAGVAKRGWKQKTSHDIKKERKNRRNHLSLTPYFWKCFFKMLFPNSFVLESLSLLKRRGYVEEHW